MADYMVLNDTRKKGRSVSRSFKNYQFYGKENKPNSMKCGFETNKILTAITETDHNVTTSKGKTIHKKLSSKPLKFQTSRKTDEQKRATSRCRRCGKLSSGEYCETHRRLRAERDPNNNKADDDAGPSHTMTTMPLKKNPNYSRVVMYNSSSRYSDSITPNVDRDSSDTESNPEETCLRAEVERQIQTIRDQTPTMTSPIGCSTAQLDPSGTPIRGQETNTAVAEEEMTGKPRLKQVHDEMRNKVRFELEPRRSEKIKTAKSVGKLGGVEYF